MAKLTVKSLDDLRKKLISDPKLVEEFKKDPVSALGDYSVTDIPSQVYKTAVTGLIIVIILIIVGIFTLYAFGKISNETELPTLITAIGSAAIGAVAGLLTQPSK
ncbi:hypothetical protein [Maribellus mangrovi]|uniref:hypothetical protein n=1 Tax=Maribellus mangrovi TaxID=3133146 RepID=UPI0030ED09ED